MSGPNYAARFDKSDCCVVAGWATYHKESWRRWWHRWRCRHGHVLPTKPDPSNGHSPQCYARCQRCTAALKWFLWGQHRYGGIDTVGYDDSVPAHVVERILKRAAALEKETPQ